MDSTGKRHDQIPASVFTAMHLFGTDEKLLREEDTTTRDE
jgi:hypothetical protein